MFHHFTRDSSSSSCSTPLTTIQSNTKTICARPAHESQWMHSTIYDFLVKYRNKARFTAASHTWWIHRWCGWWLHQKQEGVAICQRHPHSWTESGRTTGYMMVFLGGKWECVDAIARLQCAWCELLQSHCCVAIPSAIAAGPPGGTLAALILYFAMSGNCGLLRIEFVGCIGL